jgi:hypothetical protein
MKQLKFDATLNLKQEPNELIVFGTVFTDRVDDIITLEKELVPSIIETVLVLKLNLMEGIEEKRGSIKPFIIKLNDQSTMHYTNVTIRFGDGLSKTQIVKILG